MISGTPAAEVHIDAELVRALLQQQHADLAARPLTPMESGWDNMMFRLGDEWAVRLPRRAVSAALIEREQRWLPMLAGRLPLPVPAPVRVGVAGLGYPWRWSIVKWLPGAAADVSPPAADQASVLAHFLRALHTQAPSDAPRNPVRGVPLQQRADVVSERMARLHDRTLLNDAVRGKWAEALRAPIDDEATWIHGDLHARNVLVERGRLSAVIDWGDLAQGDRATDLACMWMLLASRSARQQAMSALGDVSEATWRRARGWAIFFGVTLLDTGLVNDPRNAVLGERILERIVAGP
jgi:aminoglycoside phosphotransferase (APT) family kinase protein